MGSSIADGGLIAHAIMCTVERMEREEGEIPESKELYHEKFLNF